MSDFSLMDAIECGIVKLPRVPVADNIPGAEKYVIAGSSHSTIFDNTEEHCRVVESFFTRNSLALKAS
jgi:hypothetical protein